jgi:dephospho-CoA kinase
VAALLAAHGAIVLDSDVVAREVVEPGTPGLRRVVAEFGPGVLAADGTLNRPALAALVFGDGGPDAEARRQALNAIVHPLVRDRMHELTEAAPAGSVVVQDIPLLVETGLATLFDEVVVVDASEATRVDRLVRHRGMTAAQAEARIAAQASRERRLAAATRVVRNDGTTDELARQVDRLWRDLSAGARR